MSNRLLLQFAFDINKKYLEAKLQNIKIKKG